MKVEEVIDFLKKAVKKTFSSQDKYWLLNAIETLCHMDECGCFEDW